MFLGLRTLIYPAPDLDASKAWFTQVLGKTPYFDESFYVGFDVGGYEIGLDPDAPPEDGPTTYLGVNDAQEAFNHMIDQGASAVKPVRDVGEGIRVATVRTPDGFLFGLIQNPNFAATPDQA